jgi:hypothetical protein
MTNNSKKEWDDFFYSVVQARFPLSAISEIESFRRRFEGHEDYNEIDLKCSTFVSFVYSKNNLPEKSLEINLNLFARHSPDHPQYHLIIGSALRTSAELKRTDEVMPYAVNFLKTQKNALFDKLPVLVWYVKYYPQGENGSFIGLEVTLSNIIAEIGAEIDHSLSFTARVNLVNDEFVRANRELGLFNHAYGPLNEEKAEHLLKEYLAKEPLGFFRDAANKLKESRDKGIGIKREDR